MTTQLIDALVNKLTTLSICKYCGGFPCDGDCITWHHEGEILTWQEFDDRVSLELARGALEDAKKLKKEMEGIANEQKTKAASV
jgi:hypothetical protein